MKKFIIISLLLLPLGAYGWESFMDKCINSWVGYPLDSVIKKWGYPNYERNIADKKLYVWEEFDYDVDPDRGGGWVISKTDKKGRETTFTSGGVPVVEYCRKTLETDDNNKPVLRIGRTDSTEDAKFATELSNSQLSFLQDGSVVAYINSGMLNIQIAQILSSMVLGKFTMTVADDGETIVYS